jgi:hypothetical protein
LDRYKPVAMTAAPRQAGATGARLRGVRSVGWLGLCTRWRAMYASVLGGSDDACGIGATCLWKACSCSSPGCPTLSSLSSSHTHLQTHSHPHTPAHTPAHTHTRTHTNTPAHTHTHTSSEYWNVYINSSSYLHHKNKISKNILRTRSPFIIL